jgi:ParB-like chromosome segregation protein Spo0J
MEQAIHKLLPVEQISIPEGRLRPVTKDGVKKLIESFNDNGDFGTITVRAVDDGGYEVIAGAHRLTAAQQLEWPSIHAMVYKKLSDDQAKIMECDENLARKDLTALQARRAITIRLKAFERIHPSMAAAEAAVLGGKAKAAKKKSAPAQSEPRQKNKPSKAVEETAAVTGRSAASIKRAKREAIEEMEERHDVSGETWAAIAKDYGYTADEVKESVEMFKIKRANKAAVKGSDVETAQMVAMSAEGKTNAEIAEHFGVIAKGKTGAAKLVGSRISKYVKAHPPETVEPAKPVEPVEPAKLNYDYSLRSDAKAFLKASDLDFKEAEKFAMQHNDISAIILEISEGK